MSNGHFHGDGGVNPPWGVSRQSPRTDGASLVSIPASSAYRVLERLPTAMLPPSVPKPHAWLTGCNFLECIDACQADVSNCQTACET